MNKSHDSMRDDYKVSCEEIDALVDLARGFDGGDGSTGAVYRSSRRLREMVRGR